MQYLREENIVTIVNWINDDEIFVYCNKIGLDDNEWYIKTLEGNMKVSKYDYIIKGVNGEFYPCKPDIFEKTYEKVEE